MDFQFIHSVAKGAYVDFPSSKPVPNAYMTELRKYAGAGDGNDADLGGCYSYFTIKPSSDTPASFFNHVERKKNASYPCDFIQSFGWIAHGDMLLNGFDEIFTHRFFTEEQIDGFADSGQIPPADEVGARSIPDVTIHRDAISAILFGCFRRWQMGTPPLRIVVPKSCLNSYNEYVLGAVKELYSFFPAYLRAEIGFCSYLLPQHLASYPCFGLIFVPQAEADGKAILLDGSSPAAYEAIPHTTGLKALDLMIRHISGLGDREQRKQYLHSVYQSAEAKTDIKRFNPVAYSVMGEYLRILYAEGSVQDLIPLWISYTEQKQKYQLVGAGEVDQLIEERLTAEELRLYVERVLSDRPTLEELLDLEVSLFKLSEGNAECTESVWEDLCFRLEKYGYRAEDVLAILRARESDLISAAGREAVERECAKWTNTIVHNCLDSKKLEMRELFCKSTDLRLLKADLQNHVKAFLQLISPYAYGSLKEEMRADIQAEADALTIKGIERVSRKIEENKSRYTSPEDYEKALRTLRALYTMFPDTDSGASVRAEITELENELKERMTSSQTIKRELIVSINAEKSYFGALSKAAEKIDSLSQKDAAEVRLLLKNRVDRPDSRDAYLQAFKAYSGSSFSAASLQGKPDFYKNTVMEDLASFYSQPQRIDIAKKGTDAILRELHSLEREAEFFGQRGTLRIDLGKNCVESADVVEQLCSVRRRSKALTAKQFASLSELLLKNGSYNKEQLSGLLNMAVDLDANLKPLTRNVLQGCVDEMDEGDYCRFIDLLQQALVESGTTSKTEAMGWICKEAGNIQPDPDAASAIRALRKEYERIERERGKKKRRIIIFASTAGALVIVALGLILWRHFRPAAKVGTEDKIQEAFLAGAQTGQFTLSNHSLSSNAQHDDLKFVSRYYRGTVNAPDVEEARQSLPLTAEELEQLNMGFLCSLDLSENMDLESLTALRGLKGIKTLKLDNCVGLRPEALLEMKGISSLKYLSLLNIPEVTQELAETIAQNNNPGCLVLWTENDQERCCVDGNVLPVKSSEWMIDGASDLTRFEPLLNELQELRELKLQNMKLSAEDLSLLWRLHGLELLDFSGAGLRDEQFVNVLSQEDPQRLENLRVLNLSGNPDLSADLLEQLMGVLPEGCFIARNGAEQLPEDVVLLAGEWFLKDTADLDLHGRLLSEEDLTAISQLSNLTRLNLANTGITVLPDLSALTKLAELDVSQNDLGSADLITIQQLTDLRNLRLVNCGLKHFPDLYSLANLTHVDLSNNPFLTTELIAAGEDDKRSINPNAPLRTLILADCGINSLPSYIPPQIIVLDLSGNDLSKADLGALNELTSLKQLNLSRCQLTEQPDLRELSALQSLDLSGNRLEKLNAEEALPCASLKGLSLAHNTAEEIDLTELSLLINLSWLDLTDVKMSVSESMDDKQGSDEDDIIDFSIKSIPGLRVLIVESTETIDPARNSSNCLIVPHN